MSELRQRSDTTRYGNTNDAIGMNQPKTPSSGEMRSPVRPNARAFLAVRHVHITSSTIITTLTKFTSDTTLLPESFTCDDKRLACSR